MKLLFISIPLKSIPEVKKVDVGFTLIISTTLLTFSFIILFLFLKTYNTPDNATLLVYKPTGENFYINHQRASEAFTFSSRDKLWSITSEMCKKPELLPVNLSVGLASLVCKSIYEDKYKDEISRSIIKFKKDRIVIYKVTLIVEFFIFWMIANLLLSIHYKKKIKKYIIKQHKIAESYV